MFRVVYVYHTSCQGNVIRWHVFWLVLIYLGNVEVSWRGCSESVWQEGSDLSAVTSRPTSLSSRHSSRVTGRRQKCHQVIQSLTRCPISVWSWVIHSLTSCFISAWSWVIHSLTSCFISTWSWVIHSLTSCFVSAWSWVIHSLTSCFICMELSNTFTD